jgi:transcriptional regulator with XRE-family HTH domain
MTVSGGSLGRRRLGLELRDLRTRNGMTLEQVAERFEWSVSKASRMELGRVPVTARDVGDLLTLYGVSDEAQRAELLALARASRQRDWWSRFDDVMPRQFSLYLGFEANAAKILSFEISLIPGLLQTAEYTRALIRAKLPLASDDEVERRVEARIERQQILTRENPPQLWVIVDEAAIRREIGGAEVMSAQLKRILEVGTLPNVTVQVLPFAGGAHGSMESGFIVLTFEDPQDPDVACLDLLTRSLYMEDRDDVDRYRSAFEHLRAQAASPADSTRIIAAAAREKNR